LLGNFAVDQRIGEAGHVTGRLPDLRVHDDGRFDPDDIVAAPDHVVPPAVADVFLQFRAERSVIEKPVEAAVDFGRRKHKPAALRERDEVVHGNGGSGGRVGHSPSDIAAETLRGQFRGLMGVA